MFNFHVSDNNVRFRIYLPFNRSISWREYLLYMTVSLQLCFKTSKLQSCLKYAGVALFKQQNPPWIFRSFLTNPVFLCIPHEHLKKLPKRIYKVSRLFDACENRLCQEKKSSKHFRFLFQLLRTTSSQPVSQVRPWRPHSQPNVERIAV